MLAPRPLTIQESTGDSLKRVSEIFAAAGAANRLRIAR